MKISDALSRHFQKHRIIFWYDASQELFEQYSAVNIPEVEIIEVTGNEFEVKYRITRQNPDTKFLLYFKGSRPANVDNWLLDIELAHYVFQTDQESMYLQEIGLGYHFRALVAEHIDFFKQKERREALFELLGKGDEHTAIRYKMLAVLFGTENISLMTFIQAHGSAYVQQNDKYDKELRRFNLWQFYWNEIEQKFHYKNDNPSIYDFLIEGFKKNFRLISGNNISRESRLLFSIWKNTIPYRDYFTTLSAGVADALGVEQLLMNARLEDVLDDDLFELTDKKVIHELVSLITLEKISTEKLSQYIKERDNKFWHPLYAPFYNALAYAGEMIQEVRRLENFIYEGFQSGVDAYVSKQYKIDFLYRKFVFNFRQTNQNRILSELADKIEKVYTNDWLLSFNNKWQLQIDALQSWPTPLYKSQQDFFKTHVESYINKDQRIFVIITDALRFEAGMELSAKLMAENRIEASCDHMIGMIPSYTQLGMAALLPHDKLSWQNGTDIIEVDAMSSSGTAARAKILEQKTGNKATAITAEDFMRLNTATEGRDFVKKYNAIYIYHNRIDKTGDDKTTEVKVFEAVEEELRFLIDLLKKINAMNGTNMIITSDHGFLYQFQDVEESDFSMAAYEGDFWKENRRFVIGKNLVCKAGGKYFSENALCMNAGVIIPKSINRFRIKGSGSRFIHGGASLQEIIVPLVKVSVKRKDTTKTVDVDIIKSTDSITTNILAVSFIQTAAVTDNVLPLRIRASIKAGDNELLSDIFNFNFDSEEVNTRLREVKHRFQLSAKASGKYKNQTVNLLLEQPVEGSSQWKPYKSFAYTLNISFTSDFDEF